MNDSIDVAGLLPSVADKITPMVRDLLAGHGRNLHSFHIVGSAVIPDYNEKMSDVNSVVVLHDMDLKFIEFLAPLGKKYGRKGIAAPLVMTPGYIRDSLDAFPIEFHDFRLIHKTVYGRDLLKDLEIEPLQLRIQCEREIKTKQIAVRQGYVSSLGKSRHLKEVLIRSFTGSMALFRAILFLLGKEPPVARPEVIAALGEGCRIDTGIFSRLLALKNSGGRPSEHELRGIFEQYYRALEAIGTIIEEISA